MADHSYAGCTCMEENLEMRLRMSIGTLFCNNILQKPCVSAKSIQCTLKLRAPQRRENTASPTLQKPSPIPISVMQPTSLVETARYCASSDG